MPHSQSLKSSFSATLMLSLAHQVTLLSFKHSIYCPLSPCVSYCQTATLTGTYTDCCHKAPPQPCCLCLDLQLLWKQLHLGNPVNRMQRAEVQGETCPPIGGRWRVQHLTEQVIPLRSQKTSFTDRSTLGKNTGKCAAVFCM